MTTKIWILLVSFLSLVVSLRVNSQETNQVQPISGYRNVMVLVGYTDKIKPSEFSILKYQYDPFLGMTIVEQLKSYLNSIGGVPRPHPNYELILLGSKRVAFHIVDTNFICPNDRTEPDGKIYRSNFGSLCPYQVEKIKYVFSLLANHIKNFDDLIYIGHAREGMGLGIGPFESFGTYPIYPKQAHPEAMTELKPYEKVSALNWMGGQLKNIALISCNSNSFYGGILRSLKFHFSGADHKIKANLDEETSEVFDFFKRYVAAEILSP